MKQNERDLFKHIESELGRPMTDKEKVQALKDDATCKQVLEKEKKNNVTDFAPIVTVVPARRRVWNIPAFRYAAAVIMTCIICLSIVLPLILRNNDDEETLFRSTNAVGIELYEFLDVINERNARFFNNTDTIDIGLWVARAFITHEEDNRENVLSYSIDNLMIGIMDPDDNSAYPIPLEVFEIRFMLRVNVAYGSIPGLIMNLNFQNLPYSFNIDESDVEVRFTNTSMESRALVTFEYNGLDYFISIERGITEVFGNDPIPDYMVKKLINNMFLE